MIMLSDTDPDAFNANLFDRYSLRPQSMENTSLYEFASKLEVDYKKHVKLLIEIVIPSMQAWMRPHFETVKFLLRAMKSHNQN